MQLGNRDACQLMVQARASVNQAGEGKGGERDVDA